MAKRRTIGENPLDLLIPIPGSGEASYERSGAASGEVHAAGAGASGSPVPGRPTELPLGPRDEAPATAPAPAPPSSPAPLPAPSRRENERSSEVSKETESYLTFLLAGEEYAVRVRQAREILEYQPVTTVPTTPGWIRGVMNLRGGVVPVVDLAVKFGLPPTAVTKRTCIVVVEVDLEGEAAVMGVMADAVSQVLDLKPESIEKPPAFGTRVHVDYLVGMTRVGERLALVLDVDRVLSAEELMAAAQAPDASREDPEADEADADGCGTTE